MLRKVSPFALGATLYMPATRDDLLGIVFAEKLEGLRSVVVCLEDAVSECDIDCALHNLYLLLQAVDRRGGRPEGGPLVFVRPRNSDMAAMLAQWPLMRHVDGFVMPKLTLVNLGTWDEAVRGTDLFLMPTLETKEVFDPSAMVDLRDALQETVKERIIALRIGGNDLMGCLGLRRNPVTTLYQTPMGYVIPMLAGVMGVAGFSLTAPVFEQLQTPDLLEAELALDIAHGLVGKTAIHPTQVAIIHRALQVSIDDLNSARAVLNESAPAVFQFNGAMCEPATHLKWAQNMVERARWHGVRQEKLPSNTAAQLTLIEASA
jgi:citrate lyase beta subunit